MALETRLGGSANGLTTSASASASGATTGNSSDDAHHHHHLHHLHHHHHLQHHASHLNHHLHMKVEPMNSSYFPTDASILTMGPSSTLASSSSTTNGASSSALASQPTASAAAPSKVSTAAAAAVNPLELQWKVAQEERDRYFAECRALKHELASAMLARRSETQLADTYARQLQSVVDTFERDLKALLTTSAGATAASSSNDDLAALRQKLLEVNHALARQQTEILELKERESRHALPESQRVKWQIVMLIKKSMQELDLKALAATANSNSSSAGSSASSSPVLSAVGASSLAKPAGDKKDVGAGAKQTFEERLDGVRPSVFELLFRHDMKVPAMASAPTIDLDLDAKACTQVRHVDELSSCCGCSRSDS